MTTKKAKEINPNSIGINVVAIHKNGTPASATGLETWGAAARRALSWIDDHFYNSHDNPIEKVFISDGTEPIEYLKTELAEIAGGR